MKVLRGALSYKILVEVLASCVFLMALALIIYLIVR